MNRQKTFWVHNPPCRNESYSDTYLTDPALIQALGPFDLDPCTPEKMPWETARKRYTKEDDGFISEWNGFAWLNPPYSELEKWLNRLADHGNGIALVFARTETQWFFDTIWNRADGIFFFEGRIYYFNEKGKRLSANAGGPSCLAAYGDEACKRIQNSRIRGKYLSLI